MEKIRITNFDGERGCCGGEELEMVRYKHRTYLIPLHFNPKIHFAYRSYKKWDGRSSDIKAFVIRGGITLDDINSSAEFYAV